MKKHVRSPLRRKILLSVMVHGEVDADFDYISRTLIHVVPEPGLLLLFAAGAAGMARLGRMRMRG